MKPQCISLGIFLLVAATLADPERCSLPKKEGPCKASIPNYYYNLKTGRCEKFMYGGCGGNDNRFMSLDDCIQSCSCHVKPDAGPCKALKERWYYNPSRGCCEKFTYGGCQGNSNNFQTYDECNKMCSGSFTISLKPAGLNWGSLKISSISGDRSMGGTFGKKFGGSRTVWLHSESAPIMGKSVMQSMQTSGTVQFPGQIIGKEVAGPGLVQAEKTRKTWFSGPQQTIGGGTMKMSSGGTVLSAPSVSSVGSSFSMNSLGGKTLKGINPGGVMVSSQGGLANPGGLMSGGSRGLMNGGAGGLMSGGARGFMSGGGFATSGKSDTPSAWKIVT